MTAPSSTLSWQQPSSSWSENIEIPPAPTPTTSLIEPRRIATLPEGSEPTTLALGPSRGAYYIDAATETVWRVDRDTGESVEVLRPGDASGGGASATLGTPVRLMAAGPDLIVVDDARRAWRWRPSRGGGGGQCALSLIRLEDGPRLPDGLGAATAFGPPDGAYLLYFVDPLEDQILRYQQTFDGSRFTPHSDYLVSSDAWMDRADQIHVDPDMYVLADGRVRRYRYGRLDGSFVFRGSIPANGVETDYRLMAGSRDSGSKGRLYLYDAANRVMMGFDKEDAQPVGSWTTETGSPELAEVRGMVIVGAKHRPSTGTPPPDSLVWITPEGLFLATLQIGSAIDD